MSRKNTVYFTSGKEPKLVLISKHKRNKSTLWIHPILRESSSGMPIKDKDYDKRNAIAVLKFDDTNALEILLASLCTMRDEHLRREGMFIRELEHRVKKKPTAAEIRSDIMMLKDRALHEMSSMLAEETERRTKEKQV